jgi:FixJ family two-component response regulator
MRKLVSVVDDDVSVRESLPVLLKSFGLEADAFASAEAFLGSESLQRAECLILDVAMPGMSGPELQEELARRKHSIPIIFITANAREGVRPQVMQRGAVAYLVKPFGKTAILSAVNQALGSE